METGKNKEIICIQRVIRGFLVRKKLVVSNKKYSELDARRQAKFYESPENFMDFHLIVEDYFVNSNKSNEPHSPRLSLYSITRYNSIKTSEHDYTDRNEQVFMIFPKPMNSIYTIEVYKTTISALTKPLVSEESHILRNSEPIPSENNEAAEVNLFSQSEVLSKDTEGKHKIEPNEVRVYEIITDKPRPQIEIIMQAEGTRKSSEEIEKSETSENIVGEIVQSKVEDEDEDEDEGDNHEKEKIIDREGLSDYEKNNNDKSEGDIEQYDEDPKKIEDYPEDFEDDIEKYQQLIEEPVKDPVVIEQDLKEYHGDEDLVEKQENEYHEENMINHDEIIEENPAKNDQDLDEYYDDSEEDPPQDTEEPANIPVSTKETLEENHNGPVKSEEYIETKNNESGGSEQFIEYYEDESEEPNLQQKEDVTAINKEEEYESEGYENEFEEDEDANHGENKIQPPENNKTSKILPNVKEDQGFKIKNARQVKRDLSHKEPAPHTILYKKYEEKYHEITRNPRDLVMHKDQLDVNRPGRDFNKPSGSSSDRNCYSYKDFGFICDKGRPKILAPLKKTNALKPSNSTKTLISPRDKNQHKNNPYDIGWIDRQLIDFFNLKITANKNSLKKFKLSKIKQEKINSLYK